MGERKTFLLSSERTIMKGKAGNFRREYTLGSCESGNDSLKTIHVPLPPGNSHVCSGMCVAQFEGQCFSPPPLFTDM